MMSEPTEREFAHLRMGDVFVYQGSAFKKVCDRTAAPFRVGEEGVHEFDSPVSFFGEEVVETESRPPAQLDDQGMTIQEFERLVAIARTAPGERQGLMQSSMHRSDHQHLSTCAREVLDAFMGNRCSSPAAAGWHNIITAFASR